jgi:hypothetical protein
MHDIMSRNVMAASEDNGDDGEVMTMGQTISLGSAVHLPSNHLSIETSIETSTCPMTFNTNST